MHHAFNRQSCIIVLLNLSVADGFPHAEELMERAYPNVTVIWVEHSSSTLVIEFAGIYFRNPRFEAIRQKINSLLS